MLQSRMQRQIPERLSHYTNIEALKSILSDKEGKGICLGIRGLFDPLIIRAMLVQD